MIDAMTPEEWAGWLAPAEHWLALRNGHANEAEHHVAIAQLDATTTRHGLAALALYGQPFGFTSEDVELLRWIVAERHSGMADADTARAGSLADRIAALLPQTDAMTS